MFCWPAYFQINRMEELKSTSNVSVLHIFDTIYSADSVEWCPHKPCQHVFVCANYQLDNTNKPSESSAEKCKRFGKILLFSINKFGQLTIHQTIDTEAVLDQKWCHNQINGHSILGVVTAKNRLEIYKLDPELPELQLVTRIENEDGEVLMLSLDWSTGKYASDEPTIVTSDSKGSINLFDLKDNTLIRRTSWNAHSFEAWICAFYYWDTSVIFTGGDDCKLVKYDLRVGPTPLLKSSAHSAGVTCLHSNREKEHILASGSYDSNLLLWDIRNMKRPISSTEMPDTLWRVKWNPRDYKHLLVACMRGGFHIVDAISLETPEIVVNYYEHKDLAYGSDWCYLSESEVREYSSENNHIIAACSFYDHTLSVATVNL